MSKLFDRYFDWLFSDDRSTLTVIMLIFPSLLGLLFLTLLPIGIVVAIGAGVLAIVGTWIGY